MQKKRKVCKLTLRLLVDDGLLDVAHGREDGDDEAERLAVHQQHAELAVVGPDAGLLCACRRQGVRKRRGKHASARAAGREGTYLRQNRLGGAGGGDGGCHGGCARRLVAAGSAARALVRLGGSDLLSARRDGGCARGGGRQRLRGERGAGVRRSARGARRRRARVVRSSPVRRSLDSLQAAARSCRSRGVLARAGGCVGGRRAGCGARGEMRRGTSQAASRTLCLCLSRVYSLARSVACCSSARGGQAE